MIRPWAAKLEVTEQSVKRHRMAAFQPSGSATVRATTLNFQVFLYLLLDYSLLDCSKQLLCLPESQTDVLQAMLFALRTGDLLHLLTNFGFGDEVEKAFITRSCQKEAFPLLPVTSRSVLKLSIDFGAGQFGLVETITMASTCCDGSLSYSLAIPDYGAVAARI